MWVFYKKCVLETSLKNSLLHTNLKVSFEERLNLAIRNTEQLTLLFEDAKIRILYFAPILSNCLHLGALILRPVCAIWIAAGQFLILQLRPNRVMRWFDVFLCGLEFKICCKNLTDRKVNLPKNELMSITNNLKFRNTQSGRVKILSLHEIHASWHNVDLANRFSGRSLTFDIYLKFVSKMFWIPIQMLSVFWHGCYTAVGDSKLLQKTNENMTHESVQVWIFEKYFLSPIQQKTLRLEAKKPYKFDGNPKRSTLSKKEQLKIKEKKPRKFYSIK